MFPAKLSVCDIILITVLVAAVILLIVSLVPKIKTADTFLTADEIDAQLETIAASLARINIDKIKYNLFNL